MAKRKNNGSDPVKRALLDELDRVCRGLERVFTRAELAEDPEYALARRLEEWAKDLPAEKPFLLVTVSGGVATIWDVPGVDTDLVDWDSWDGQDPTRDELAELREIAERIRNRGDKARFLRQVQELEDRGVAEDEDDDDDDDDDWAELREMTKVEMDDKRRRRKQIPGRNQVGTVTS